MAVWLCSEICEPNDFFGIFTEGRRVTAYKSSFTLLRDRKKTKG